MPYNSIDINSNNSNGSNSGSVRIYENNNDSWQQIGSDIVANWVQNEKSIPISLPIRLGLRITCPHSQRARRGSQAKDQKNNLVQKYIQKQATYHSEQTRK